MSSQFDLRQHQKDVVARILYTGTALMAHEVGAGKTAAMIAAGMMLRQSGAVRKPVYVVPNHLLEQWQNEFLRFYPTANVLVATKKDFEKQRRKQFFGKIAAGDYDAIIIGHSSFEKIPISAERQRELISEQITHITDAINQLKEEKGESWSIKQMEIQRNKLDDRYKLLLNDSKKDDILNFEQLGIDFMFVDEAHDYKNCFTFTKMHNVGGVGQSSSQRAMDMLLKCQYLQEVNHGRGVVFATGTPISNSMSEMFVMQRYLQPNMLHKLGLEMFDNWAATFGEIVTSLEINPEGTGYRMKTRFAKFHNLPELLNVFRLVADIQTADMLQLPTPEIQGGKPEVVVTQCSPYQKAVIKSFAKRAEAIRNGQVDSSVDNMLKLTLEAKLLAIDPRLLNPLAPNYPDSKLNRCIQNVLDIYKETADQHSTQVIFSDIGIPNGKASFNVYDEVRHQLVAAGVPENEVAFIHEAKNDAQREELFEKMRKGEIRVLLGSTQKLGTGTNMQDRLIAIHHLDCPYRPSDITQRNGRGLRQGNINPVIRIFDYVTKGTFDSYLWQIQEQKLKYITQIMSGKSISRSCEDVDETVLSAAEVKALATDNPLVAEKMKVDNEVTRLKILRANWQNEQLTQKRDISKTYPERIAQDQATMKKLQEDIQLADSNRLSDFSIELDGKQYDKRTDAGDTILLLSRIMDANDILQQDIGHFRGFTVGLEMNAFRQVNLVLKGSGSYTSDLGDSNAGNLLKLEHLIDHLPDRLAHVQQDAALITEQLAEAKASINVPFEFEQELSTYLKRQVEIDTKLEFDRAKQEDVISDEDAIKNEKEGQSMKADKKGVNDNPLGESVISQQNELFEAVKQKDDHKVKQLLDAGAYADVFDAEQKTPLYYAVSSGNEKMTRLLIDAGANPELRAAGRNLTEYCTNDNIRAILQRQEGSNTQTIDNTPEDDITRGRSR